MSKRSILAASALLALSVSAKAQIVAPWDYPPVLSATAQQVLPLNPARRRIIFVNPNTSGSIAFCPSGVTRAGVAFACAVNGAGSITLSPLGSFVLDGGTPNGPPLAIGAAWIGVASGTANATVLEFE